jgi:hypothetical protein
MFWDAQDFTSQKLIQKELEDNQLFIQKYGPDAFPDWRYNIQWGNIFYEPCHRIIAWCKREKSIRGGANFSGHRSPDDLARIAEENSRALECKRGRSLNNELIVEFSYRLRHANGDYRWFNTYGSVSKGINQAG